MQGKQDLLDNPIQSAKIRSRGVEQFGSSTASCAVGRGFKSRLRYLRLCTVCLESKPEQDFYGNGRYLRGECKPCTDLKQAAGRFGITVSKLKEMYTAQSSRCAICKEPCKVYRNLSIDHDHRCCPGSKSCGKCVRGLLCAPCNKAIGLFGEQIEVLESAIKYLGCEV